MPQPWPRDHLPEQVEEFIDWLCNPDNRPWNCAQYERDHNLPVRTTQFWKKHPRVRPEIEKRANDLNMSPERAQAVMNAIFAAAVGGDMKAATLYLQHIDKLKPRKIIIQDERIESLTDEQLQALLAEHA